MEQVYIGSKELPRYLSAGLFALGKSDEIVLYARGSNIKKAIDVAEILKRQMENPTVDVTIGSDKFEDRFVSTIEITLKGKKMTQ